jgi:hypothetical protein
MFGIQNHAHLKGKPVGLVSVQWKMRKRRERLKKRVVVLIDEYLTSQVIGIGCNKGIVAPFLI